MKKTIYSYLALIAMMLFTACNGNSENHEGHNHNGHDNDEHNSGITVVTPSSTSLDSLTQNHMDALVHYYSHIHEALANDDAQDVLVRAEQLNGAINDFDTTILNDEEKVIYHNHIQHIISPAKALVSTEDIAEQRVLFKDLSESVLAFEGKGGIWLSETEDIANLYYGSDMYSCGNIEEVVRK